MPASENLFFWYELLTSDPEAAGAFYRDVVGWDLEPYPGSGNNYTLLGVGDRKVGGIVRIPEEMRQAGGSPCWLGYVLVADVDEAAKSVAESGGSLLRAPADIPTVGRFAVVADPGGAVFQLLAPLPRDGPAQEPAEPGAHGTVGWHELYSAAGQAKAFAFYETMFGWETMTEMDMGAMGTYRIFGRDGVQMGGMMDKPADMSRSSWTFYVNVDGGIDAAAARIGAAGGSLLMGPMEVPGGSWIVQARDPQGADFALVSAGR